VEFEGDAENLMRQRVKLILGEEADRRINDDGHGLKELWQDY